MESRKESRLVYGVTFRSSSYSCKLVVQVLAGSIEEAIATARSTLHRDDQVLEVSLCDD